MKYDATVSRILKEFKKEEFPIVGEILKKYGNRRILFSGLDKIDRNVKIAQPPSGEFSFFNKPKGLWYALGSEWFDFMEEQYETPWEKYKNVFYLGINYSEILRINTPEKFLNFANQYGDKTENSERGFYEETHGGINWAKVAQKYKGIEIIPYQSQFRMNHRWYYGWDIGSGCIWDTSAINDTVKLYPSEE